MDFNVNPFKPKSPPLSSRTTTPTYAIQPLGSISLSPYLSSSRASENRDAMAPFRTIDLPSHSHLDFADRMEDSIIADRREDRIIGSTYDSSPDRVPDGVHTRGIHQPRREDIFAHPPHPVRGSSLPLPIPESGSGSGSSCPPPRPEIGTLPITQLLSSGRRGPARVALQVALPVANALDAGRQSPLGERGGYDNCFLGYCANFCRCIWYI